MTLTTLSSIGMAALTPRSLVGDSHDFMVYGGCLGDLVDDRLTVYDCEQLRL